MHVALNGLCPGQAWASAVHVRSLGIRGLIRSRRALWGSGRLSSMAGKSAPGPKPSASRAYGAGSEGSGVGMIDNRLHAQPDSLIDCVFEGDCDSAMKAGGSLRVINGATIGPLRRGTNGLRETS